MEITNECDVVHDLLPVYQAGLASAESCRLIEAHLQDCADCRARMRSMDGMRSMDRMRAIDGNGMREPDEPAALDVEDLQKVVDGLQRKRKVHAILRFAAIVLLTAAVAVFALPAISYTKKINRTVEASLARSDSPVLETTTVRITGTLRKYLLGKTVFTGVIQVDALGTEDDAVNGMFPITTRADEAAGLVAYLNPPTSTKCVTLGYLLTDDDYQSFVLWNDWYEGGISYVLCYPAENGSTLLTEYEQDLSKKLLPIQQRDYRHAIELYAEKMP